jgi:anaerobic ribonucleoside-triphosphate reductase activating protein
MRNTETTLQILDIIRGTTVDGPGFRTSIYIAGCNHHCPGCHNPQSWDANAGTTMSIAQIMEVVREEEFDVTLSGGDPLMQPDKILPLLKAIKEDKFNIWVYTGYQWEDIIINQSITPLLKYIDVIVDGEFKEALRDESLFFRGSSNQRLIDVQKSIAENDIVLTIHQ